MGLAYGSVKATALAYGGGRYASAAYGGVRFLSGGTAPPASAGVDDSLVETHVVPGLSGDNTIAFPAVQEGDWVYVSLARDFGPLFVSGLPADTAVVQDVDASIAARLVRFRVGETPPSPFTITENGSRPVSVMVNVFRGAQAGTSPEGAAADTNGSATPASPAITTTVAGSLVAVWAFVDDTDGSVGFTAPAGYANLHAVDGQDGASTSTAIAYASRTVDAVGAEDPGAWGIPPEFWLAHTREIVPA